MNLELRQLNLVSFGILLGHINLKRFLILKLLTIKKFHSSSPIGNYV